MTTKKVVVQGEREDGQNVWEGDKEEGGEGSGGEILLGTAQSYYVLNKIKDVAV